MLTATTRNKEMPCAQSDDNLICDKLRSDLRAADNCFADLRKEEKMRSHFEVWREKTQGMFLYRFRLKHSYLVLPSYLGKQVEY